MKKTEICRCLLRLGCVLLMLMMAGCLSFEAESDHMDSDISLQELLKREEAARDPGNVFRRADSDVQKQILTDQNGRKKICIVRFLAPDCLRTTLYNDNKQEQETILNGNSGWQVDHVKRSVTPLSQEFASRLRLFYQLNETSSNAYGKLFEKIDISRCRIGEENVYKLVCHPFRDDQFGFIEYIGESSFLPRRMRITAPGDPDQVLVEIIIDRYALFEGVMVPEQIRRTGMVKNSSRVIEHHLNVPMKRTDFLPPVFPQIIEDEEDND